MEWNGRVRRLIKHWTEEDVHTVWRRYMKRYKRAGASARDKRFTTRRERRDGARYVEEGIEQFRDEESEDYDD